jgi:hypothetical protein
LICDLLGAGSLAAKVDGDIRTLLRHHQRYGRANAARGARHQSRLAEKSFQIVEIAGYAPGRRTRLRADRSFNDPS